MRGGWRSYLGVPVLLQTQQQSGVSFSEMSRGRLKATLCSDTHRCYLGLAYCNMRTKFIGCSTLVSKVLQNIKTGQMLPGCAIGFDMAGSPWGLNA